MTNTFFIENLSIISSVEDEIDAASVSLYPSVTSESFNLVFEKENNRPVSILSANGSMVKQFRNDEWLGVHNFSVIDLPDGQYFVRMINDDKLYTIPFIKN